jgi:hypothetical protein
MLAWFIGTSSLIKGLIIAGAVLAVGAAVGVHI